MTVTVRQARAEDAEDIVQLQWDAEDWLAERGLADPDDSDVSLADVRENIGAGRWYVAQSAGIVVGTFRLTWPVGSGAGTSAILDRLVVDRASAGLGGELLRWIGDHVRSHDVECLRVACVEDNGRLLEYYRDQGFTELTTTAGAGLLLLERRA
ncbi:GNAT family N-acetyltransferase [Rhodococcus triatomae]|uniref:Uncharacterized protein n=1 Tax=Rhodococcus triatomae TaxID=300028 RepID=A0A1G8MD43_9NOCA|nr:GNAT family N-acetyltransferase [Rhodococcus triatomae]QNG18130.1 GNAT family N-acetyltransferase [Rhodococcus triatomae]QNG22200.1 GNAT family N-acetyltransferase [Rhodococcus triatomae]SDI65807.1 hypothetical protein SAMN05444695_109181 [Rhodococcus triatomae]